MSELGVTIWKLELKVTRITRVRSYKIKNDFRSKPSLQSMNDFNHLQNI